MELQRRESGSLFENLNRATGILEKFGYKPKEDEITQLAHLLDDLADVDSGRVTAIARVMEHQGAVEEFIREEIEEIKVAQRYQGMISDFDSIAEDMRTMVSQLEDGKIDLGERTKNVFMRLTRGTIKGRFDDIRDTFRDVSNDTMHHLERQETILEAYGSFRESHAEAEVLAYELRDLQQENLNDAITAAGKAQEALDAADKDNAVEERKLRMARDRAVGAVKREKARFDLAQNLANGLAEGFQVGETVMMQYENGYEQTNGMYQASVVFFRTRGTAFTGLEAALLQQKGLHEMTQTQRAMREGGDKLIDVLGEVAGHTAEAATRETYGPGFAAEKVIGLLEDVEAYQVGILEKSRKIQEEAEQNTRRITTAVSGVKERVIEAFTTYQRDMTALPAPQ